jgi:hypothetical protein
MITYVSHYPIIIDWIIVIVLSPLTAWLHYKYFWHRSGFAPFILAQQLTFILFVAWHNIFYSTAAQQPQPVDVFTQILILAPIASAAGLTYTNVIIILFGKPQNKSHNPIDKPESMV